MPLIRLSIFIFFAATLACCKNKEETTDLHYPSEKYEYVSKDTSASNLRSVIYVPVYSHIYILNGTRPLNLAATLSVRSIEPTESIFVSGVDYYNSNGQLVRKYLDSTLLLKPMHSAEFVVEEKNTEGGAGAYFLIHSSAPPSATRLLTQAIMVSQANSLGITFKTEGIPMDKK